MNRMYISSQQKALTIGLVVILSVLASVSVAGAQSMETFGHVGTMRILNAQVRDGLDVPVAGATVDVKNVATSQTYSLDADDRGVFRKDDIPPGKYLVTISAGGFNGAQYTVTIGRKNSSASTKYTVIRLSPGCASGNSGVALVSKLSQRSFKP